MFAVIQRYAQPGERVLVIGGQGHVAILKLFLDDDERRAVDVTSYL
jgi:predicted proteasome-type protease